MRLYCGLRVCRGAYPALQYPYGGNPISLYYLFIAKQSPFKRYEYMNLNRRLFPRSRCLGAPRTTHAHGLIDRHRRSCVGGVLRPASATRTPYTYLLSSIHLSRVATAPARRGPGGRWQEPSNFMPGGGNRKTPDRFFVYKEPTRTPRHISPTPRGAWGGVKLKRQGSASLHLSHRHSKPYCVRSHLRRRRVAWAEPSSSASPLAR